MNSSVEKSDRKQDLVNALDELLWYEDEDGSNAERTLDEIGGEPQNSDEEALVAVQDTRELRDWLQQPDVHLIEGNPFAAVEIQALAKAARQAHDLIERLADGILEDAGSDEDEALEIYDALEHALEAIHGPVQQHVFTPGEGALASPPSPSATDSKPAVQGAATYTLNRHTVPHPATSKAEVDEAINATRHGIEIATSKVLVYIAQQVRAHDPDVLAIRVDAYLSDGAEDVILDGWRIHLCTSEQNENGALWNAELDLSDRNDAWQTDLSNLIDALSSILEPLQDGAVLIAPTYALVYFSSEEDFLQWFANNAPSTTITSIE